MHSTLHLFQQIVLKLGSLKNATNEEGTLRLFWYSIFMFFALHFSVFGGSVLQSLVYFFFKLKRRVIKHNCEVELQVTAVSLDIGQCYRSRCFGFGAGFL